MVFLVHHADEDADVAVRLPGQRVARVAGVFQGRIGALQEQAFLRIGGRGVARRNIEKHRVEFVDAVDKAAPFAVGLVFPVAVGVEIQAVIPALRRNLADAVLAVFQVVPELLHVGGARITPGQADNGDVFLLCGDAGCGGYGGYGGRRRHDVRQGRPRGGGGGKHGGRLRLRQGVRRLGGQQAVGMVRRQIGGQFGDVRVFEQQGRRQAELAHSVEATDHLEQIG